MKKIISSLLFASFLFSSCSSNYSLNKNRIERNNLYSQELLKNNNPINKKEIIKNKLEYISKTPFRKGYDVNPPFNLNEIDSLNENQLLKIYILLNSLEDEKFREKIGEEITIDLIDPQVKEGYNPSERIGVFMIYKEKLKIVPVESIQSKEKLDSSKYSQNNSFGEFPENFLDNIHFIPYHLHATKIDNSQDCGPSIGLSLFSFYGISGDMGALYNEIQKFSESHQVVITNLSESKFNVTYYGGKKKENKTLMDIINLGDYEY